MKKKIWQRVAAISMSALIAASSIPLSGSAAYAADRVKNLTISDSGNDIIINSDGNYHISGTTTKHSIIVNDDVAASITLDNVTIDATGISSNPLQIGKQATVTLILSGSSVLKGSGAYEALELKEESNTIITSINGDGSTVGNLKCQTQTGAGGTGIGICSRNTYSDLTIKGGTVVSSGIQMGAYSSGMAANKGTINIYGGVLQSSSACTNMDGILANTVNITGGTATVGTASELSSTFVNAIKCENFNMANGTLNVSSGSYSGVPDRTLANCISTTNFSLAGGVLSAKPTQGDGIAIGNSGRISGGTLTIADPCGGNSGYNLWFPCGITVPSSSSGLVIDGGTINLTISQGTGIAVPNGSTLTINNGTVISKSATGIGGKQSVSSFYPGGGCGKVIINGGNVTATGATGIGGGNGLGFYNGSGSCGGNGGNITITGGTVHASGTIGAGIGGGAPGVSWGGNGSSGSGGTIGTVNITGGTVVTSSNEGASIGSGRSGNSASGKALSVSGNTVVIMNDSKNADRLRAILADNPKGIIFQNGSGLVYGTPTIVQDTEFPANNTLTVEKGKEFKVAQGVKLTTSAMINIYGKILNNGTIRNKGQIGTVGSGTIDNLSNSNGTTGIVQYAVILHRNDGSSDDLVKEDCWVTPGKPYSASLPELTRPNYVLVGWKDDSGNAMDADEIADGWNPVTLYAQWAQVGKIRAKVTDSDTGQPVSGVVVVAKDSTGNEDARATTGSDGTVLLPNLKPGTYSAQVITPATGYSASAAQTGIAVEIGKTSSVAFTARPFKGSAAITHLDTKRNKLIAIAPISVTDRNGKVVYTGSSTSTSLTVPSLRVPDAPFTVKETAALANYRTDAAAYTANLTADGQTANVEMHSIPMMGDITYTATDKDGKPIVGATVNLVDKDGNVVATGTTDSNGKITFKDVFTGDYTVQLPGYENGNVAVTVKDQQNTAPAPVKAAMLVGTLEITHVDAQSNKALPVAKVQLKDKSGKVVYSGAPADNGTSLTIPNLTGPASPYTLTEETPITNYHANTTQYPVSITTQGQAVKVVMKSSQYAGDVTLHITDPTTGKSAADVKVNLIDKDDNIAATGKTDKDGNVTFTNVPIGTYTYAVDDPRFKLDGDKTKSVTVTDGSKQTASIPVISLGNVTLHITDPSTGKPASGVTVNLIDKDRKVVATGKTDENGNVTFSGIPAGDYTYKVDDPRFVSITGKVTIGTGNTAGTIDIEVKHPASSPTVSKTGSANITATDNSGKPLANVPVIIKDSTGKTVGTGTTDSDGKVTVPNLPDGTYTISSGDSSVMLEGSITITNGQTTSVTLKGSRVPTGNAKLLVVDTHQQPLKNFTLLVMRVDSPAANSSMIPLRKSGTIVNSVSSENNQVVAEVTTDANGYVILPQLDAGQYILIAKDSSEYKVDSSLAIVPSTTVSATVTATPISTSSSKQPAASASTVSGSGTKAPAASNNNQPTAETPVESSASVPSDYTVPKTGQSGIIPAIVLVLMAVCGTAGVLFSRKKSK
ncbi:SpaA isopeptide-forming pilin-related protein [Caproicibacterium amylolyticum]|uniref:Carboxypeptidase regulatory-like domain-containing protein n=1 Tax=Caproicibacterium amylolyticum TaxID=2766537 RepID=A0A7G9WJM0_9FIRM|nr:carboxypeptidase regulatory-like domain-containing protein [Caproicibacterium amylolyticum]QNO18882.1 carboxypeptidase regulatory-like domain-containing protein [Caproicibacterium amylolyticum]